MRNQREASTALLRTWPHIVNEARLVLGSELHYQAMVYHCLRVYGQVPVSQLGMNVKMWIDHPVSKLFRQLDRRKHKDYRGGFEPIPDVCLFSNNIASDWRRRNHGKTMAALLLAIEIKASERNEGRLQSGEIIRDIEKLSAHREEARHLGGSFLPVMMVIDTAPEKKERMTPRALLESQNTSRDAGVKFLYVSQEQHACTLAGA